MTTATVLGAFQQSFTAALQDPQAPSPWDAQPALAVYRNTVLKAGIDTLEANYPSIARLVGRDWFRSAAAIHARQHPPRDGRMLDYGQAFIGFLREFAPAADLPYLPDVARLDRFWTESHAAADAPVLRPAQLARLSPEHLAACCLTPHPAARWAWFDDAPIYTIWSRNRAVPDDDADEGDFDWRPEGALLTRAQLAVQWQPAQRADCAFLDACAQGCTLAVATERAATTDPQADLGAMLTRLMNAGALAGLDTPAASQEAAEPAPETP